MSERVPNMRRHEWPPGIEDDLPCSACGTKFVSGLGTPCPGKPEQTEAPRIDLQKGDTVLWATAGKGEIESLYEGHDGRLVASVLVAGWFWDQTDQCYTREDTGVAAALEIRAADLKKGGA